MPQFAQSPDLTLTNLYRPIEIVGEDPRVPHDYQPAWGALIDLVGINFWFSKDQLFGWKEMLEFLEIEALAQRFRRVSFFTHCCAKSGKFLLFEPTLDSCPTCGAHLDGYFDIFLIDPLKERWAPTRISWLYLFKRSTRRRGPRWMPVHHWLGLRVSLTRLLQVALPRLAPDIPFWCPPHGAQSNLICVPSVLAGDPAVTARLFDLQINLLRRTVLDADRIRRELVQAALEADRTPDHLTEFFDLEEDDVGEIPDVKIKLASAEVYQDFIPGDLIQEIEERLARDRHLSRFQQRYSADLCTGMTELGIDGERRKLYGKYDIIARMEDQHRLPNRPMDSEGKRKTRRRGILKTNRHVGLGDIDALGLQLRELADHFRLRQQHRDEDRRVAHLDLSELPVGLILEALRLPASPRDVREARELVRELQRRPRDTASYSPSQREIVKKLRKNGSYYLPKYGKTGYLRLKPLVDFTTSITGRVPRLPELVVDSDDSDLGENLLAGNIEEVDAVDVALDIAEGEDVESPGHLPGTLL